MEFDIEAFLSKPNIAYSNLMRCGEKKRQKQENRVLHLCELEMVHKEKEREHAWTAMPSSNHSAERVTYMPTDVTSFDASKHINLVPPFRESEVDAYFIAFEWIVGKLKWPKEMGINDAV